VLVGCHSGYVASSERPPLYWSTWRIAGPGVLPAGVVLIFNGHVALAFGLVSLALVLFFVPWLLSPYSKAARRIVRPTDEDFQRVEHVADWLGRVPLFGVVWRSAERMTGNVGRREAEEYRRWLREHDDGQSPNA
jgi:hypothetical protein